MHPNFTRKRLGMQFHKLTLFFFLFTIRRNDFICTGSIMLYMKELIIYFCHSNAGNFPSSTLIGRNTNIHFNF